MESYSVASLASGFFHSKFYSWDSFMLFACRDSSFFLFAELYTFGRIRHKLFTHSTANEYLDCFQLEAIRNSVPWTFLSHLLVHICRHLHSAHPQEVELWGHKWCTRSASVDTAKELSKMVLSLYALITVKKSSLAHILADSWYCALFAILAILVVPPHWGSC